MIDEEYFNLIIERQKYAKYTALVWDVIGSKNHPNYIEIHEIMLENIVNDIKKVEIDLNKKILVDEEVVSAAYLDHLSAFLYADNIVIKIYRNKAYLDLILNIFERNKIKIKNNLNYHFNYAHYETDSYVHGDIYIYSGYLVKKLTEIHKVYNKKYKDTLILKRDK